MLITHKKGVMMKSSTSRTTKIGFGKPNIHKTKQHFGRNTEYSLIKDKANSKTANK